VGHGESRPGGQEGQGEEDETEDDGDDKIEIVEIPDADIPKLPPRKTETTATATFSLATPPDLRPLPPTCTVSTMVFPSVPADGVWTEYPRGTTTATAALDCDGCALRWETGTVYFFVPPTYTATVTAAAPSVEPAFTCLPTGVPGRRVGEEEDW